MDTSERTKILTNKGYHDLDKKDIYKASSMIRDTVTKEVIIPFKTRPSKTDESRDLAWIKVHEDAINPKLEMDKDLKKRMKNQK